MPVWLKKYGFGNDQVLMVPEWQKKMWWWERSVVDSARMVEKNEIVRTISGR